MSSSRLMTTPLNFIFEPLGTERMLVARSRVVVVVVCVGVIWPMTSGAAENATARMQPAVNGRNLLKLIVCSFNPSSGMHCRAHAHTLPDTLFVGAISIGWGSQTG